MHGLTLSTEIDIHTSGRDGQAQQLAGIITE